MTSSDVQRFVEKYITSIECGDLDYVATMAWDLLSNQQAYELCKELAYAGIDFLPYQLAELENRVRYGLDQFEHSIYNSTTVSQFLHNYMYDKHCGLDYNEFEQWLLKNPSLFPSVAIMRSQFTNQIIIMCKSSN